MIYKKCIMTINKNNATLDEDIYLFRLDKNIELHFTIVNNKYKFEKSDLNNIIAQTNAAYFQIRLYKSDEIKYTFAIQPTQDGVAVLTITDDLINDPIEVGEYDFQISLLDADKTSMISMPIVTKQLHVCEPLVDNQAIMGRAVLGLSSLASGEIKNAFDSEGNYIREIHNDGDILSAQLVNKFEEALDTNTKAIKNSKDTNSPHTISSKVLVTVPASDISLGEEPKTISNVSININRRYYIEFLGSKKLCSVMASEEMNGIICSINGYIIQAMNQATDLLYMIINTNAENTPTFTDLIIYEEEVKYLDSKYLETDLVIQNSISLGRVGDIAPASVAIGEGVQASGNGSHAEGGGTQATGTATHAEGINTTASGNGSHAEGEGTTASGMNSHAEGDSSTASGYASHAEGSTTTASGASSHAEGDYTTASGASSHAEGYGSKASSQFQHVQGKYNIEDKNRKYAHIVGNGAGDAKRSNAHTLDWKGNAWFAGDVQGSNLPYTISSKVLTTIPASDITLDDEIIVNNVSINKDRRYYIEFLGSKKLCNLAISENNATEISCIISNYVIQGMINSSNLMLGVHKMSPDDTAIDTFTDLVIYEEEIKCLDNKYLENDLRIQNSISLGRMGNIGTGSSAIGMTIEASGMASHAEGYGSMATGNFSHAEGSFTKALNEDAHAEGSNTIASSMYQHVQGKNNIEDAEGKYAHIVGNGEDIYNRANAHTLDWNGNGWYAGKLSQEGTPTEDKDLTTKKYVDNIKTDINTIKTDLGTAQLTTTAKDVKGAVNEVAAQYKDIMSQLKDMLERIGLLENYHKPKLYDLPRFNMVGDISNMSKTNPKTLDIELLDVYGTPIFNNKKATVKWQGDSSLSHPKKNYAIKMFENDGTTKFKYKFFDDVKANDGYHLKAEYQDSSTHARNTVLARLTKSAYKNPLAARCCIDSFPIEIYINGEYQGLYNWNLKQHKSVYGLDDANPNHLMYRASSNETLPTPCNFRALSTNNEEDVPSDWEDRFPETNTAENRAKLNRLITFIKDSDDATFKANFEQYMNLEYTLIYRISCQVFNMVDSLAKNMNILTYDGNIWYPTFYDMDSTLGIGWGMLFNNGAKLQPTNVYPTGYGCPNSLLWEKFDRCFAEEIKQRYAELRTGVYAYDNIINQLQTYINLIPQSCFDRDWAKWTACPHEGYGLDYIKTFMTSRLNYVDGLMTSTTPSEQGVIQLTDDMTSVDLNENILVGKKLNENGEIETASGSVTSSTYLDISKLNNTTLDICIPLSSDVVVCTYDANKKFVSRLVNKSSDTIKITLDSTFKYIRLMINTSNSPNNLQYIIINGQSLYKYAHIGVMTSSTKLKELTVSRANTCYINIPLEIGKSYTVKTNGNNDRFRLGTNDAIIPTGTDATTIKRGLIDDNNLNEYTFTTTEGDNYLFGFFLTNDATTGKQLPGVCLILNN